MLWMSPSEKTSVKIEMKSSTSRSVVRVGVREGSRVQVMSRPRRRGDLVVEEEEEEEVKRFVRVLVMVDVVVPLEVEVPLEVVLPLGFVVPWVVVPLEAEVLRGCVPFVEDGSGVPFTWTVKGGEVPAGRTAPIIPTRPA